jgi:hypothetical protein
MIKFKRQELEWHCRASKICECGHYGDDRSFLAYTREFGFACRGLLAGTSEEDHEIWKHSIVPAYSGLSLTRSSDRPPTLSGLASLAQARIPLADYLAGIWKSDLVRGLQWYCEIETARYPCRSDDPKPRRIQTWSWVSVPGPVAYPFFQSESGSVTRFVNPSMKILRANCHVAGSDPYGEVSRGRLVIRAPLVPVYTDGIFSWDGNTTNCAFETESRGTTAIIRYNIASPEERNKFYPDTEYFSMGVWHLQSKETELEQ